MKTFIGMTLVALVPLTGTIPQSDDAGKDLGDYFPMKIGNKWEYRMLYSGREAKKTRSVEITGTENVATEECFVMSNFIPNIGAPADGDRSVRLSISQTKGKEGVYVHKVGQKRKCDPPELLIKYPLKIGEQWESTICGFEGIIEVFEVDGEEVIEVPAGKMKCMRIRRSNKGSKSGNWNETYWLAKDVGLVKCETLLITYELKSFSKGDEKK